MRPEDRRRETHRQKRLMELHQRAWVDRTPSVARGFRAKNIARQTSAELAMTKILDSIGATGFVAQKPLRINRASGKFYIADFYFQKPIGIVIEVDGGYHADRGAEDNARDEMMRNCGLRVIRFSNDDVLNNPDRVSVKLQLALCHF